MTIMNDDNREFDEDDNEYNECGQLPSAYLSGMFPLGSGLSRNSALYPLNLNTVMRMISSKSVTSSHSNQEGCTSARSISIVKT